MTTSQDRGSTIRSENGRGLQVSRRDVVQGAGALAVSAAVGSASTGRAARAEVPGKVGHVTTSDGVSLHYLEAGEGKPILMIPGWSQTAEQFKYQLTGLADRYRVIAVDMRGHGESDKPEFGYKISRLAKDTHDLIHALELDEVNILGHSMGCSVIWNYWDMFGPERLSKLLLIDQMPMITSNPGWSEAEKAAAGSIFTPQSLYETINALAGPEGVETTRGFVGNMVTKSIAEDEKTWIIERNLRMPRQHAATLLYNHSTNDWRDLIPASMRQRSSSAAGSASCPGSPRSGSASRSRARASRSSRRRTAATTSCSSRVTTSSTTSSPTSSADQLRERRAKGGSAADGFVASPGQLPWAATAGGPPEAGVAGRSGSYSGHHGVRATIRSMVGAAGSPPGADLAFDPVSLRRRSRRGRSGCGA